MRGDCTAAGSLPGARAMAQAGHQSKRSPYQGAGQPAQQEAGMHAFPLISTAPVQGPQQQREQHRVPASVQQRAPVQREAIQGCTCERGSTRECAGTGEWNARCSQAKCTHLGSSLCITLTDGLSDGLRVGLAAAGARLSSSARLGGRLMELARLCGEVVQCI